jgi:enamine deaminase RidA (YjgF/YER057c/UK114 family)
MTGRIAARLKELDLTLPPLATPMANYVAFQRHGDLVFLSGQTSSRDGVPICAGAVPTARTVAEGYEGARQCGLNLLAALSLACEGDLDRVAACLKVNGYVQAAPGFDSMPAVVDGASDLIVAVFGDAGRHARTAVGVAALPRNASVEVEAVFTLHPRAA